MKSVRVEACIIGSLPFTLNLQCTRDTHSHNDAQPQFAEVGGVLFAGPSVYAKIAVQIDKESL
jgi:hypothetical protein